MKKIKQKLLKKYPIMEKIQKTIIIKIKIANNCILLHIYK